MTYEKKECWSILLRLYHWAFALSIITLVVTGLYINWPWTNTMQEGSVSWPMAKMRFIHFSAGYLFTAAVLVRIFLFIFGNKQERITDMLPITKRNINNLGRTLVHYSYITDKHDSRLGHNVLAGLTYVITILAALLQLASGFYLLFPENRLWESWGVMLFASQQSARFVHHLLMWWFIIFAFVHIYLVILNDIRESEGIASSIFTGRKFKKVR